MASRLMGRRVVLVASAWLVPVCLTIIEGFLRYDLPWSAVLLAPIGEFMHDPALARGLRLFLGLGIGLVGATLISPVKASFSREAPDSRNQILLACLQLILFLDFLATSATRWFVALPGWLAGLPAHRWTVVAGEGSHFPWPSLLVSLVALFILRTRARATRDERQQSPNTTPLVVALVGGSAILPVALFYLHRALVPTVFDLNVLLAERSGNEEPILPGGALAMGLMAALLSWLMAELGKASIWRAAQPQQVRRIIIWHQVAVCLLTFCSIARPWCTTLPYWLKDEKLPLTLKGIEPSAPWSCVVAGIVTTVVLLRLSRRSPRQ